MVAPSATIQLFMKVTVAVTVEEAGQAAQRSKLVVRLVKPFVEGLSGTPEDGAKKDGKAGVARLGTGADNREGKRAKRK